jgi:hypothetical protein
MEPATGRENATSVGVTSAVKTRFPGEGRKIEAVREKVQVKLERKNHAR